MKVIEDAVATLRSAPYTHVAHLVVRRNGKKVAALQFGERPLGEPADVYSVTKSVVATLVLAAVWHTLPQAGRASTCLLCRPPALPWW